jgi:hypothetical protein
MENLGGTGKGFDRDRSLSPTYGADCGTGGSGFESVCSWGEDAVERVVVPFGLSLGGTGGALFVACDFRLRKC